MKRIYACIAIVAVLLSVAFYSSWKVQSFADVISADLDTAAEAIRNADYPAARQALADGADRCAPLGESRCSDANYFCGSLRSPISFFSSLKKLSTSAN